MAPDSTEKVQNSRNTGAVLMNYWVEHSLLKQEVRNSNPDIGKIYFQQLFTVNCVEKTKKKKN